MCTNSVSTSSQCTEWKICNWHVYFRVCSLRRFEFNQKELKWRSFRTASNICAFIYNYANNSEACGFFLRGLIVLLVRPMKRLTFKCQNFSFCMLNYVRYLGNSYGLIKLMSCYSTVRSYMKKRTDVRFACSEHTNMSCIVRLGLIVVCSFCTCFRTNSKSTRRYNCWPY